MTVSTLLNRKVFAGDGSTTVFAFPYWVLARGDLRVVLKDETTGVETLQTITTHYSVSGDDVTIGSRNVTMLTAPTTDEQLIVYNDPAITQGVDYVENQGRPAETQEGALDRLTLISQRLKDRVDRSLRLTDGFVDSFDTSLPEVLPPNTVIAVNGDGDGFELVETGDLSGATTLPSGTGLAVYTGTGAFGAARTITAGQGIAVTNGSGVSGNPTIAVPDDGVTGAMLNDDAVSAQTAETIPSTQDTLLMGDVSTATIKKLPITTLLSYFTPKQNFICNGNFDIWQRGTAFAGATNGDYSADRWMYRKSGTIAVHTLRQQSDAPTLTQSLYQSTYCLEAIVSTADAALANSDRARIEQRIEGYQWAKLKNRTAVLSFWVKATKTGTSCVAFRNSAADRSIVADFTISATATWEYKTVSVTLNPTGGTDDFTNGVGLIVSWALMSGLDTQVAAGAWATGDFISTANQVNHCDAINNSFKLSQVMLTIGDEAPIQFQSFGGSIAQEIREAERFFEKSYAIATALTTATANGAIAVIGTLAGTTVSPMRFRTRKRGVPVVHAYSTAGAGPLDKVRDTTGAADRTASYSGEAETGAYVTFTAADGSTYLYQWTADAEL